MVYIAYTVMKSLLLLLLCATPILGLTKEQITKLSELPHDRKNITEHIAFFPDVRAYHITMTIRHPENVPQQPEPILAEEKVVKGQFLISTYSTNIGKQQFDVIKVIEYSEQDKCYKQWTYNHQLDTVTLYKGFRLEATNQISWHSTLPKDRPQTITTNEYYEDHVVWSHQDYIEGKLSFSMDGVSKKFQR